jgi:hypothetical protein
MRHSYQPHHDFLPTPTTIHLSKLPATPTALGWSGPNCNIDVDECLSSPCENGGTCAQGLGVFECTCVEGYEGAACFFALALPTFLMPLSCALFFSLLCSSVSVCSTHHVVKITKFKVMLVSRCPMNASLPPARSPCNPWHPFHSFLPLFAPLCYALSPSFLF